MPLYSNCCLNSNLLLYHYYTYTTRTDKFLLRVKQTIFYGIEKLGYKRLIMILTKLSLAYITSTICMSDVKTCAPCRWRNGGRHVVRMVCTEVQACVELFFIYLLCCAEETYLYHYTRTHFFHFFVEIGV
jgi:hypothetical protein